MAKIKGWESFDDAGLFEITNGKENDALELMMMNISDEALGSFDPSRIAASNLIKINEDHGYGFVNPESLEQSVNYLICFEV
jgi:hypothetical protein